MPSRVPPAAAEDVTPEYVTPEYVTPEYVTPEYITPEYVTREEPTPSVVGIVAAGALFRLSVQVQANVGLRLSVDSQHTGRAIVNTPRLDARTESFTGTQRSLELQRVKRWSLGVLMQALVAGTARNSGTV